MNRALLVLFLAASMAMAGQEPKAKTAETKAKATETKTKAAEAKTKATETKVAAKPAASGALVANKDSKTYHRADCKSAAKIKEANRASFASAAEADKAGYKACKVCKP